MSLKKAIHLLLNEKLVVIPTETVYGLAALASSDIAVSQIYAIKERPTFNPLIVHISDFEMLKTFAQINENQKKACSFFWNQQKPLTVVLPLKKNHPISPLVTAGLKTIAVRIPNHPLTLDLIKKTGPLAAPSANKSNTVSPTTAEHVKKSFGMMCPYVLNGGNCSIGLESTILDLTQDLPTLLRPGGVSLEELANYYKKEIPLQKNQKVIAPGMMKKHYSPGCPVYLNTYDVEKNGILIGFGLNTPQHAQYNLSPNGDLIEAAKNLFDILNEIQDLKPKSVSVMPIPKIGIGLAINDRLERAAAI
jgi:L-threonylcarbamoyladenylate synthase